MKSRVEIEERQSLLKSRMTELESILNRLKAELAGVEWVLDNEL